MPLFLSLFLGFVTLIVGPFAEKNIFFILFFSLIFSLFEFLRGNILTGFPWNLIAFSFSNQLEILSIISLIGTYGFNLFCISLFSSPALLLLRASIKEIIISIFFLLLLIIFYIYGTYYGKKFNSTKIVEHNYKVRVIGSSISLDRFYNNINAISIIEELIEISDPKMFYPSKINRYCKNGYLNNFLALFYSFSIIFAFNASFASESKDVNPVETSYINGWQNSDSSIQGALTFYLKPGFLTYWRNPGPLGLKPHFDWSKSLNIKKVTFDWPIPKIFNKFDTQIIGYEDELILPIRIEPKDTSLPMTLHLELYF